MKPPISDIDAVFGHKLSTIDGKIYHGEETIFFYSPKCRTGMTVRHPRVRCSYTHASPMYAYI